MVIIFDAVNQLPEEFHNLRWLPEFLAPRLHIIVSSTSGTCAYLMCSSP